MKILLKTIPVLFITLCFKGLAQPKNAIMIDTDNVMSFFTEQYGDDAKEVYKSNPEIINQMTDFLENHIYLIQNKVEPTHLENKLSNFIVSAKSPYNNKFSPTKFNPFKYGLDQLTEKTIIHIDNSRYVVIVDPRNND